MAHSGTKSAPGQQLVTGYLHSDYARSMAEFGTPRRLPQCGGWILQRTVAGSSYHDCMGCYPLFCCQDWGHLHRDLEDIGDGLVSLSLVTDPFGDYHVDYLRRCFPDVSRPFKRHLVVDLNRPLSTFVSRHHRRNARKALQAVQIEKCPTPIQFLDDWVALYSTLIRRHGIEGIRAFSRQAFEMQLQVPGLVAFRAVHRGLTIGMLLWYIQGEVAYYHLGAHSTTGYQLQASFALFWRAIEYFRNLGGVRWLNLGAGAGTSDASANGLSRFKRGWATGTRTSYFCGRILDQEKYAKLTSGCPESSHVYFPAYRTGEFA
jgi:hypothetical protein